PRLTLHLVQLLTANRLSRRAAAAMLSGSQIALDSRLCLSRFRLVDRDQTLAGHLAKWALSRDLDCRINDRHIARRRRGGPLHSQGQTWPALSSTHQRSHRGVVFRRSLSQMWRRNDTQAIKQRRDEWIDADVPI